jgi:hypothetical protein
MDMPMRSEIVIPARLHWEQTAWDRLVATLMNRDLLAVIGFCTLGLLLTMCFLHSSADPDVLLASLVLG